MSAERLDELEAKLGILDKIVKVGWALLIGAFGLGAWATLLEIRTQGAQKAIELLQTDASMLVNWRSESNGNRYTSGEHAKFATEINASFNGHDKRITRLEDTSIAIQKSLDRIESKLQTK